MDTTCRPMVQTTDGDTVRTEDILTYYFPELAIEDAVHKNEEKGKGSFGVTREVFPCYPSPASPAQHIPFHSTQHTAQQYFFSFLCFEKVLDPLARPAAFSHDPGSFDLTTARFAREQKPEHEPRHLSTQIMSIERDERLTFCEFTPSKNLGGEGTEGISMTRLLTSLIVQV